MPPDVPASGRFTAYLPAERGLLAERARAEGTSENYLVRVAVRAFLGLPVPAHYRLELLESLQDRHAAAALGQSFSAVVRAASGRPA
jgi:hypothetical protein